MSTTTIQIEDRVDRSGEHPRAEIVVVVNELVVLKSSCIDSHRERWAQREYVKATLERLVDEWFRAAP